MGFGSGEKSKEHGGVQLPNSNTKLLFCEGIKQIRSIEFFHHQQQVCWFLIDLAAGRSAIKGHGAMGVKISKWGSSQKGEYLKFMIILKPDNKSYILGFDSKISNQSQNLVGSRFWIILDRTGFHGSWMIVGHARSRPPTSDKCWDGPWPVDAGSPP